MPAPQKADKSAETKAEVVHLVPNGHKEKLANELADFREITNKLTKAKQSKLERQERTAIRLEMLRKAVPLLEAYQGLVADLNASMKDVVKRLKDEGGFDSKVLKLVMARRADENAAATLNALLDQSAHLKKLLELDFDRALQLELEFGNR